MLKISKKRLIAGSLSILFILPLAQLQVFLKPADAFSYKPIKKVIKTKTQIPLPVDVSTPVPCLEDNITNKNYPKSVRVGISDTNFLNYYRKSVELTSDGSLTLRNKKNNNNIIKLPEKSVVSISFENNVFKAEYYTDDKEKTQEIFFDENPTAIVVVPSNGFTKVVNLKRAGKDAVYRGVFELVPATSKPDMFALVNILGIESYLRGVVPNEMPVSFGNEALKAQAIAARNYVLKPRVRTSNEYDICDSVTCQVYFGAGSENPLSDIAVAQTENNVASYKGEMILAQYSSTAGGYTENYENAFLSNNEKCIGCSAGVIPYLRGKPDNAETPVLNNEQAAKDYYTKKVFSYDCKSPFFRWKFEWDKDELQNILSNNINNKAFSGFIKAKDTKNHDFGNLEDIIVTQRGVSGKVISMKIITDTNEYTVQKELIIRQLFKKNGKSLPSANIVFELTKTPVTVDISDEETEDTNLTNVKTTDVLSKIKIYGGGFGHGVGMSQFGAGRMHELGFKYYEILQHYYTGIAITTPKINLSDKNKKTQHSMRFYAPDPKGILYIHNYTGPSSLTVEINGNALNFDFDRHSKSKICTDISQYIKAGKQNYVTYTLSGNGNSQKSADIFIELKGAVNE